MHKQTIKLRPMSEAPRDDHYIYVLDGINELRLVISSYTGDDDEGNVWQDDHGYPFSEHQVKGWFDPEDIEFVLPDGDYNDA